MKPIRPIVASGIAAALPAALLAAAPATAADLFGGVYKHAVYALPTSRNTLQGGVDVELGYRFDRIAGLGFIGGPAPYVLGSVNSRKHGSSFVGGGLSWKVGLGPLYVRPGLGLVVQSEWKKRYYGGYRVDLGSPVLFEPELALGFNVAPRVSLEASWVHISHATLFSKENPGLDMLGGRVVLHLP